MIKLIAMDLDGTLLNSDNEILTETKKVLMELQRKGIRLVLASGRSYNRMMRYAKELEMDMYGGFLVEINGSAIYDIKADKRERLSQIEIAQAHELFTYFMKWDVEILGHIDDGMYDYMSAHIHDEKVVYRKEHNLPDDYPWTAGPYDFIFDNRNGYPRHFYINSYEEIQESINKVSVSYHEDVIRTITPMVKEELKDRYWVGLTSPRWLEIMPLGVTKANALQMVGKHLQILPSEMMAFGDGENDSDMLQLVGVGVAMGNALEELKILANEVCDTNENNGIANTLKKYFDL